MSKRSRGSPNRGGQKRAGSRPANSRSSQQDRSAGAKASSRPPSQLEAAEDIADDLVEGQPMEAARELRGVARSTPARSRAKPTGLLAAKAATEYVYVGQDLRHIARVAALLLAILLALWLVFEGLQLVRI